MTVDTEIVHERLRLMRELLDDLDGIGPVSTERFESERVIRHAVERIITQLVDLSVSINSHIVATTKGVVPSTYRESYAAVATVGAIPADLATEPARARVFATCSPMNMSRWISSWWLRRCPWPTRLTGGMSWKSLVI